MNPKITIVILNWNGYEDTTECITSLQKVKYDNHQIVVVDNGSDAEEFNKLKNNFLHIEVLRSDVNLGFTGGNNLGIKHSLEKKADYILLLNNDTTVEPNFIETLLKVFEKEPKAGIVAPIINYFNEQNKIWSAGGKIDKLRGAGISKPASISKEDATSEFKVEFVSGCCMLIDSNVLNEIGLFDENYFLYSEDTDLCYRVNRNNREIYVAKDALIYHKTKSSTKAELSALALYYETRNRLYFVKKNISSFLVFTFLYICVSMILKGIIWLINGKNENIKAVYFAIKDFLNNKMGKTDFKNH